MQHFGANLARLRRERRLSQLQLAEHAGLSQRHISFIETGRSQPGPVAIRKLIDGLSLSRTEASMLLRTVDLEGGAANIDWDSNGLADARRVAAMLLQNHEPYPGLICRRDGGVLESNAAFRRLIALADDDGRLEAIAGNLYDLTLHPDGLPRLMVNPELVIPHTLHRLRRAAHADEAAAKVLERLGPFQRKESGSFALNMPAVSSVLCEHYRIGKTDLKIITMSAAFGCPEEELAHQVSVELFFPADEKSAAFMQALALTPR
jgi:transcriptional regulator with XRE-family HTH domain